MVVEFYVRILCLPNANSVVVLEDGAIGWFVVWLLELKLDNALIDVLSRQVGTFLMISTLNSTS